MKYSIEYFIEYNRVMQKVKDIDVLPSWLPVPVKPTYWPAAGSGTKVAATCKSAICQAKNTTKMSISYFTQKNENDWRR